MKFNEIRSIRRTRRMYKAYMLEMNSNTLRHRTAEIAYENWTKTEDYQKERARIDQLWKEILMDLSKSSNPQDLEIYERYKHQLTEKA